MGIWHFFGDHQLFHFLVQTLYLFLEHSILRGEVMNNFLVVRWFEVLESLLYLFAVQNPGTLGVLQFGHD